MILQWLEMGINIKYFIHGILNQTKKMNVWSNLPKNDDNWDKWLQSIQQE